MRLPINYTKSSPQRRRQAREEYTRQQGGKCCFCGVSLTEKPQEAMDKFPIILELFPPNFLKHPVHLHHNHDTRLTIGAVHAHCNGVLWQYCGE